MAAVEKPISQVAFIMEHIEECWPKELSVPGAGGFPGFTLDLEDLTQIVRDGCAPSPSSPSRTSTSLP